MDIFIAVFLGAVMLVTAYLGVHVTIHPVESDRARLQFKIGFVVCAIVVCALNGIQAYRSTNAQSNLQEQLTKIERDTKEPPKVQVTNNVPPPQVVIAPGTPRPQVGRHLSRKQQLAIESLMAYKNQRVSVRYSIGHDQDLTYAQEYVDALRQAGWEAGLGLPQTATDICSGVEVSVIKSDATTPAMVPESAEALAKTLESTGIRVLRTTMANEIDNSGRFNLIICREPIR